MIIFTGYYLMEFDWIQRWVIFLAAEHGAFLVQNLVDFLIPDVPPEVIMQQERQKFLVSKIIDDVADDEDVEDNDQADSSTNIVISDTDGDWQPPTTDLDPVEDEDAEEEDVNPFNSLELEDNQKNE